MANLIDGKLIEDWKSEILPLVDSLSVNQEDNYLSKPLKPEEYDGLISKLQGFSAKSKFEIELKHSEKHENGASEETSTDQEAKEYNDSLDTKLRDFVILTVLLEIASEYTSRLKTLVEESKEQNASIENRPIPQEDAISLAGVSIVLDLQMYLTHAFPSMKPNFYHLLSQITKAVSDVSTGALELFWNYMESRQSLIQARIFDRSNTSDRMYLLEITNFLTDRYIVRNSQHKLDGASKDTFNDRIQFRIRMFVANTFNFEDNTGLNKYFSISNRYVYEPTSSSKAREDVFMKDIAFVNRVFRDPYHYLSPANHKQLSRVADTFKQVYEYLIDEEVKWSQSTPKVDQFVLRDGMSEGTLQNLKKKFDHKPYFPQFYDLCQFEQIKKGQVYESLRKEDLSFDSKLFDDSKVRQICLLQVYFLCNLYHDLSLTNKKSFVKSLGATSSLKHIAEGSIPENLAMVFLKMKRDILKRIRTVDSQLSFLLQQIVITESFWWGWLIYGKDPRTGKSIFSGKIISEEELQALKEKSNSILPFKEKKYFNTYATPQLSRMMRLKRGILELPKIDSSIEESSIDMNSIEARLMNTLDAHERESLLEERNIKLWKRLRIERTRKWLNFGDLANKDIIGKEFGVSPKNTNMDTLNGKQGSVDSNIKSEEEIASVQEDKSSELIGAEGNTLKRTRSETNEADEHSFKKMKT